jgi:hypothetical protein
MDMRIEEERNYIQTVPKHRKHMDDLDLMNTYTYRLHIYRGGALVELLIRNLSQL